MGRTRRHRALRAAILVGSWLLAGEAQAHAGLPGLGDLWNGSLHLVLDATEGLTLLALGLAIGALLAAGARAPFATYQIGFGAGMLGALAASPPGAGALAALALAAAGVLIIDPVGLASRRPALALGGAAALAGLACGSAIPAEVTRFTFAAGMCLGAIVLPLAPAALRERYQPPWLPLALRIAGSWLAAVAIILLGAALR